MTIWHLLQQKLRVACSVIIRWVAAAGLTCKNQGKQAFAHLMRKHIMLRVQHALWTCLAAVHVTLFSFIGESM